MKLVSFSLLEGGGKWELGSWQMYIFCWNEKQVGEGRKEKNFLEMRQLKEEKMAD